MLSNSPGAGWTQLSFPFLTEMVPTKKRYALQGIDDKILELELARLRERTKKELLDTFTRAAQKRRAAFSEAEGAGMATYVEYVRAERVGGSWKVTAKGQHNTLGPVYRHGFIVSLIELGELLMRWNVKEEWTKDKYRK